MLHLDHAILATGIITYKKNTNFSGYTHTDVSPNSPQLYY